MQAGLIGPNLAQQIAQTWLATAFGGGRQVEAESRVGDGQQWHAAEYETPDGERRNLAQQRYSRASSAGKKRWTASATVAVGSSVSGRPPVDGEPGG